MTTLVQVRAAIVARLQAGWTHGSVPIYYENTTIDIDNVPDVFGVCFIDFGKAKAAGMGARTLRRTPGMIDIQFSIRESLGTAVVLGYLDELTALFEFKSFGGVTTDAPSPGHLSVPSGWYGKRLRVPFYFDSNP